MSAAACSGVFQEDMFCMTTNSDTQQAYYSAGRWIGKIIAVRDVGKAASLASAREAYAQNIGLLAQAKHSGSAEFASRRKELMKSEYGKKAAEFFAQAWPAIQGWAETAIKEGDLSCNFLMAILMADVAKDYPEISVPEPLKDGLNSLSQALSEEKSLSAQEINDLVGHLK
jgi:hypothetical protein